MSINAGNLIDNTKIDYEDLDIDDQKKYYDLMEFMSATVSVNDLTNAKNVTNNKKEFHRIKKEFEKAIHDLRALKRKKNEESSLICSMNQSLDNLIHICKENRLCTEPEIKRC